MAIGGNELSKEELEALLGETVEEEVPVSGLSKEEGGVLKDISGTSMNAAATALSTILNKQVTIAEPAVNEISPQKVTDNISGAAIVVEAEYSGGIKGPTYVIFLKEHGAMIADLMMGGDGTSPPDDINDLYLGALGEAVGQMTESAAASLSSSLGKTVTVSAPKIKVIDFKKGIPKDLPIFKENKVVEVDYNFTLGDLSQGKLIQLLPLTIAKPIVSTVMGPVAKEPSPAFAPGVHPVQFARLSPTETTQLPANLKLLMDVPMNVSVELGRKKLTLKNILDIGTGSVIELEKMAKEPVDILVNGKLIAKGGVVVVDDNFGVRITEILTPEERLESLK
ncbi:MAG: flagellar motor switch protein FliN [bacterium]|nr:flagellar motor switch protein FliN [bacterium]